MNAEHIPLTDAQVWTIVNALRVAARVYGNDASLDPAVYQQVMRKKAQAEVLADLIEGADVVVS